MVKQEYPHFNPTHYDIDVKIAVVESRGHSKYNINYHIVWIPKYRRKVLKGKVKEVLRSIIEGQCEDLGLKMLALEIMPDHIHLFVGATPTHRPCDIVKQIKGNSSNQLRKCFKHLPYLLWSFGKRLKMKKLLLFIFITLSCVAAASAYVIPDGTYTINESIDHYKKGWNFCEGSENKTLYDSDPFELHQRYFINYVYCVNDHNFSKLTSFYGSAINTTKNRAFLGLIPEYEEVSHTWFNRDIVHYKNSLNQSVEMPLPDFVDYFILQIYGPKKFPSKIERVDRKGEVILIRRVY